jgi:uncharacterized OB-fold protein
MQLPRFHRLQGPYYRLEGQRCDACQAIQFPPRVACRKCHGTQLQPHRLSGRGTVFSFSELSSAPAGFPGPYVVALVELEEGGHVSAQLTDVEPEDVSIGMAVEAVTRRLREHGNEGYVAYGYKFRPPLPVS